MAYFITDAQLLAYEPNLFIDLPYASQQVFRAEDAAVDRLIVTSVAGGFDGLAAQQVAVVASEANPHSAHAIATVDSDTQLTLATEPVGLAQTTGLTLSVRSFSPQIGLIHADLMRTLGLDPDNPDNTHNESAIISQGTVMNLEALGALWLAYNAAASLTGDNSPIREKAEHYRLRYRAAMNSTAVLIDTDGDGRGDLWRRPGLVQFHRI